MEKLFQIATTISTPLALGGLFAVIFFFIIKQMLAKDVFPTLTKSSAFNILKTIVDRLFVLALIAMLLGFAGYIIPILLSAISSQKSLPQASSNEPPKFRVRYFDVEGYAIDFLMKGMVDENMEKDLTGQPFIVPNEVFKEVKFIMDNFVSSSNIDYLIDANERKTEVNETSFSSLTSDILDSDIKDNKKILRSIKNDFSWNIRWRKCGEKDKIIKYIKNGRIDAFCLSFWKFIEKDDIDLFNNKYSSFYKYITANYLPSDFSVIDISYPTCTGEWGGEVVNRKVVIRVAAIENISMSAIKIGIFFVKKMNQKRLMEKHENIEMLNDQNIETVDMFPIGYLNPKEKILVPLGMDFKYDKDVINSIKESYEEDDQYTELIKSLKIDQFSIDEKSENKIGKIPYQNFMRFVTKKKQNTAVEKQFTYGPSISIEKIEIDEKVYPFRKYDEKTFVLYGGREAGSCPYAYTYSPEIKQWISEGHILYGKSSKRKEGWDSIKLKRFTGKVIIKENDPEVSFIDFLRIRVKTDDGKEEVLLPKQSLLRSEDQQYLKMKQGEQIEVEFDGFQEKSGSTFYLESKGYYEVLGRC